MRQQDAAVAFVNANNSRAVRIALLARNRPLQRDYEVGERVYYWQSREGGLDQDRWHCSALVVAVESKDKNGALRVIWVVHSTAF